jgi:hypothetical protein
MTEGVHFSLSEWVLYRYVSHPAHSILPNVSHYCHPEFELGLELDSTEVRGVLLYNGDEWGHVVFDFLNS